MIENTAIVFTVFDGYVDLWDDAIRYIKKFWPQHPPIYVFTNEIEKDWEGVTCISVGADAEWSKKVQKAIEVVKEKYFILLLEDFYVGQIIDNKDVQELVEYIKANGIKYCKLCDNNRIIRRKKKKYNNSMYHVIYEDEDYGICLQAAIWDKEFLREKVGNGNYNAWVFELNQVKETRNAQHVIFDSIIDDTRNILNIKHGALQGKMLPNTVNYFGRIENPLSTNREVMSQKDYLRYVVKQVGKDVIPKPAVSGVKKIAKLFGYSFVDEKWS